MLTPLERWLAVLHHQKPDRIPMDYWGTPEVDQKLIRHTQSTSLHEALTKLHIDFVIKPRPRYIGPTLAKNTDIFGIQRRDVDYGAGVYPEVSVYPLAKYQTVEDIERDYTWPDPGWFDYSAISADFEGYEDHPVHGGAFEPFYLYKDMRGQEQAMIDLIENPQMVHYVMEKLCDHFYQKICRILEALPGRVTFIEVSEDLGSQRGLLYSPVHIRQFIFPYLQRMIELARQADVFVFHHDDGNIMAILPELVDLGIDILNPVQWRADGMDRAVLKARFGEKLIFHGGMDNQYTLPFGSVEEVRQEVRDNLQILGAGGGYILAPCHNIQPITPIENIIAMYETGYREGRI